MNRKSDSRRHILPLSGGKDSSALAVYLRDKVPNLEYVFLDTGHELPETYEFLGRLEATLEIDIVRLPIPKPRTDPFTHFLRLYHGCLPSPQNRWCTRQLKIKPFEEYVGKDLAYSYIGLRADENRSGYDSRKKPNLVPYYPFINDGLVKKDVVQILEEAGLSLPKYYEWRSRSGCYFCFFQTKEEWVALQDRHPKLFERACQFEEAYDLQENDQFDYKNIDIRGNNYTWSAGETLKQLLARRGEIRANPQKSNCKILNPRDQKLSHRLRGIGFNVQEGMFQLNEKVDEESQCLICK